MSGLVLVLLPVLAAPGALARPHGDNVHRPGADCQVCHTADAATLMANHATAAALLVPDLETRCMGCHGDEGPSHPTGAKPARAVPEALPLSGEGRLTCATCHFMHGEPDGRGDFLRIDNKRGGLCLSCHVLSELQ